MYLLTPPFLFFHFLCHPRLPAQAGVCGDSVWIADDLDSRFHGNDRRRHEQILFISYKTLLFLLEYFLYNIGIKNIDAGII